MFNYENLIKKINSMMGVKKFLELLGLTEEQLLLIVFGNDYFTDKEINLACDVLEIPNGQTEEYFFVPEVEKSQQNINWIRGV